LVDRIAAHLLLATATVGGLLVGAALGRFKVLIMVYAAFIILLVGMTAGYAGEVIIGVVATQIGYLGFTLMAAQRRTIST
jgi:hypothetical protein